MKTALDYGVADTSTTAEMRLVERYESQNTKPREFLFRALLGNGGDPDVRFERLVLH